jgi:NAD(P)-dependent dehydrogenase (short-subunit alcohol dehydrogenase family)
LRACRPTFCWTASWPVHPLDRHRLLQRPGQGRVAFVDLHGERNNSGQRASSQSKLANVMFTYELARRLAGIGVTATVQHPGVVRASFGAEDEAAYFAVIRMARPFMKTPAEGAGTLVHLASHPGSTLSPAGTSSTEVLAAAQAECQARGWPWREPAKVTGGLFRFRAWKNANLIDGDPRFVFSRDGAWAGRRSQQ